MSDKEVTEQTWAEVKQPSISDPDLIHFEAYWTGEHPLGRFQQIHKWL